MGDPISWDQLNDLVDELQQAAKRILRLRGSPRILEPEELVNEAILRLRLKGESCIEISWSNREHFLHTLCGTMRELLGEYARNRFPSGIVQRRVSVQLEDLDVKDPMRMAEEASEQFEALTIALDRLKTEQPELQSMIELRYFLRLTKQEIAHVLDLPADTIGSGFVRANAALNEEILRVVNEEGTADTRESPPADPTQGSTQEGALSPELREWARQLSTEEEIVAGLEELRTKGGKELSDFVQELEQVVDESG